MCKKGEMSAPRPAEHVAQFCGEKTAAQALMHTVVQVDRLFEVLSLLLRHAAGDNLTS